ncbi:MAG: hypothetical protein R6U70_08800 [Bacillota bacterium]
MSLLGMLSELAAGDPQLLVLLLFAFLSISLSGCADPDIQKMLLFIILVSVTEIRSDAETEST